MPVTWRALRIWGLISMPGTTVSLLLNLEGIFAALIAWSVFREHFDTRCYAWPSSMLTCRERLRDIKACQRV